MYLLAAARSKALFLLFGSALLAPAAAWAQTNIAILQKAATLTADRKYESAFKLLDKYDPRNERPAVLLLKEELALRYHVGQTAYRKFSFRDLQLTDNLETFRSPDSTYATYSLPLGRALRILKQRYPNDYKLNRGLADYYLAVQQCDCAEQNKTEDDLFPLIIKNYETAHEHGFGDYVSYFALGYSFQRLGMFRESVPPFLRSIELYKSYPEAHLNLAFVYLELKEFEKAREQAQQALTLFSDAQHKSDAEFLLKTIEERLQTQAAERAGKSG